MINASHLSSIFFLATRKPQTCNMQANYASSSGTLDLHLAYFDQCCRSSHNSSHKFYPSSPSPSTTGESFPKVLASILCRTRECTGHGMWPGLPAPCRGSGIAKTSWAELTVSLDLPCANAKYNCWIQRKINKENKIWHRRRMRRSRRREEEGGRGGREEV